MEETRLEMDPFESAASLRTFSCFGVVYGNEGTKETLMEVTEIQVSFFMCSAGNQVVYEHVKHILYHEKNAAICS